MTEKHPTEPSEAIGAKVGYGADPAGRLWRRERPECCANPTFRAAKLNRRLGWATAARGRRAGRNFLFHMEQECGARSELALRHARQISRAHLDARAPRRIVLTENHDR